jgi:hypothetical protein
MAETLQEVFELLERTLPAATRARMRDGSEADMIDHHRGVGMWLRNQWRGGDPLPRELRGLHIHMDDLSGIVLEGFWCHLRGLQLSFDGQLLDRDGGALRDEGAPHWVAQRLPRGVSASGGCST